MPAVIFVLAVVWMQLVKGSNAEESQKEPTQRDINFEQAYQVRFIDKFKVPAVEHFIILGRKIERG